MDNVLDEAARPSGGDIFRREQVGSRFDRMGLGGRVGPRRLIGLRTEAGLLLAVHREWQADRLSGRSLGFRREACRRLSPRSSGQLLQTDIRVGLGRERPDSEDLRNGLA